MTNFNTNNYSQSSNYKVFLPFLGKEYVYAQTFSLPGINHNPPEIYTGSGRKFPILGDGIEYDPITIGLIVDEKFRLYKSLVNFFLKQINGTDGTQNPVNNDFNVGVEVTDNVGKPIIAFEFYGCQLQNLGSIMLGSNSTDVENITDLTFNFAYFEMVDYLDDDRLSKFLESK